MKGFALDEKGDLIIENNEIVMVNGNDLLKQNVKSVLSTNKGEWSLNVEEGINFNNILGKQSSIISAPAERTSGTATSAEIESMKKKDAELNRLLQNRLDGEA